MRTCLTALALVLASGAVTSAQNRITHLEAPCVQTETPRVWAVHPAQTLGWCQPDVTDDMTFALRGEGWERALPVSRAGTVFRVPLPQEVYDDLAADGRATLWLVARNDLGESAPSAAMQVATPAPSCRYATPAGAVETRPIDTAIGGTVTLSLQLTAERVGMFRRDGWRVEWQWDPIARNLIVMMWCVGTPQ